MKNVKRRILGVTLAFGLFIGLSPIAAHAEWRENNSGWWYSEDNSYATGWRNIDGSWYYFYPNSGYMASATSVNGYYLKETGEWVNDFNLNVSAAKA